MNSSAPREARRNDKPHFSQKEEGLFFAACVRIEEGKKIPRLQALAIPSFTIVIVDLSVPEPSLTSNHFLARLRARKDRRVWIFSGQTLGAFASFTSKVLPDLRDEKILQDVVKTYRALQPEAVSETEGGQGDAE